MIGNGMQQAQSVRNTDVLGDWGTFDSSDLEEQYRHQQISPDTFQSKMFLTIIVLASLALTISDYRLFGFAPLFWWVVTTRVGFALVSLGTIVVLQRGIPAQDVSHSVCLVVAAGRC